MAKASPATYGLLGLLASRSWTGYELTRQARRSLRFVWPSSEGHLYREQSRLVELGWASATDEPAGLRTRKRYAITPDGRAALRAWLATPPEPPRFEVEGLLRAFFADSGRPADLVASLTATADTAREMLDELAGYAADYLSEGGPLDLLEAGKRTGRHGGREVFPRRLPAVAVALDATTHLLAELERLCDQVAQEVGTWPTTTAPALAPETRRRLERARDRARDRTRRGRGA